MEEEKEVVDAFEALAEVVGNEVNLLESAKDDDEHHKYYKNVMDGFKLLNEMRKTENEEISNANQLRLQEDIQQKKEELDRESLEIEKKKIEIESKRVSNEEQVEEHQRIDSKCRKFLDIAAISVDVIGIIAGLAVTMKTLNVNLDSVIADKDAVGSGRKLFECFAFKRRR